MTSTPERHALPVRFFLAFGLVALVIAGLLSYLASSSPDGLDSVTLNGCTEVGNELSGKCIAQHARDHDLAGSPLADYTLDGSKGTVGVAGVIGVVVTLALAGGLFWLLRPRHRRSAGRT